MTRVFISRLSRLFSSLRNKVIAGITLLILILTGGVLIVLSSTQLKVLEQEATSRIQDLAETTAIRMKDLMVANESVSIWGVAEDLEKTPLVSFVAVLDSSMQPIHDTRTDLHESVVGTPEFNEAVSNRLPRAVNIQDADGREVIAQIAPVIRFDQVLGVVLVGFDTEDIRSGEIRRRFTVVVLGALALLAGVFMAVLLARNVVGPVERLKDAAVRIGAGEFGEIIEVETVDEIGALAETFNVMSLELKKREEEIRRSERLSAIGTTASVIAHEMKTPLTSVKTYLDMLALKYEDAEFRGKFTETVDDQITRLGKLIDDLLDYSRDTRLHPADLDLNLHLHQAVSFFRDMLVSHKINAGEDYQADQLVKADPDKLEQVFFNLIKNGIEAQGEGGAIAALTSDDEESVLAMVADAGGGIPEETAKTIFDPFITTKAKGTGLGLAIAKKIVQAHGGEIELYSPLGRIEKEYLERVRRTLGDHWPGTQQGSCFVIRLPAFTESEI